jgi:hypothetical protein
MATNKTQRSTARKQKPVTAKRTADEMTLCEVAERIAEAKKEIRDRLREIEQGGGTAGSVDKEKLEAVLRGLDEVIRPIPPIHIWC